MLKTLRMTIIHNKRHTAVTGSVIRVAQIPLGHATIGTTAIYMHPTEPARTSLKAILDKLMTGL